jgi:hypothetical protein
MPRERRQTPPADSIDDRELHAWLHQQSAEWLAGQLKDLANRDRNLRFHLWQCRRNGQPDRWSAEDMIDRFIRIAQPGEYRDERVEDAAIAMIEGFLTQLAPLAEREPTLPGFATAMARIVEIMQPMFADWGEGWYWHEVLIASMRIHATACVREPKAAVSLTEWIDARLADRSWPMQREWVVAAYGDIAATRS